MMSFPNIFQTYLDLSMTTSDGLYVRIIEKPGMSLPRKALEDLLTDLRTVASTSVTDGTLNYGIFSESGDRLNHAVITLVKDKHGKPIAFNALALMEIDLRGRIETVVHLGLVLVDPNFRSKGLSWILYGLTCAVLQLRNQLRPMWISNVTQVPAVIGMVSETFAHIFPTPSNTTKRTFTHLAIAREIMTKHRHVFGVGQDAIFDPDRFVIQNSYTGGSDNLKKTFEQTAKHRQEEYNAMCKQELNYERGDDFLQLGVINTRVLTQFVVRNVPRNALLQVSGWFAFLIVNSVFLPIIQWFDTQRNFGALRPRNESGNQSTARAETADTSPAERTIPRRTSFTPQTFHANTATPNSTTPPPFDYDAMTTRNVGFVSPEEQNLISRARILIIGVGGMGGACLQALIRSGIQDIVIADMDTFEISNLNRQVFASLSDVGQGKVEVTCRKVLDINPNVKIEFYGPEWVDHLDKILSTVDIVVNGMDDIAAGIHLYRVAKQRGVPVIDAYAAPLPSVTLVEASDPRPEERLNYQTEGTHWRDLTPEQINRCKHQELLFVFANSSSIKHFHMEYALEVFQGKRSRPSFAPMVIATGNLMAFEVMRHIMKRKKKTDCYGYFMNPWSNKVETPYHGLLGKVVMHIAASSLNRALEQEGAS